MRSILYGDDHIKIVQESTCLGLRIDNRLDWKAQVKNVCNSFSKKLGALKRARRLPKKVLEEIYYTTIIARTTYCMSFWGNCSEAKFNMLEDNHARAARLIHNLPRNLSNEESLARANWQPISFLCERRLLVSGADPGPKLSEAHASAKRELTGVRGRSPRKNFQDHALKIVGKCPNSITSLNYRATFSKGAAQGFCKQTRLKISWLPHKI